MLRYFSLLCGLTLVIAASMALGIHSQRSNGEMSRIYSWAKRTLRLSSRDVQAEVAASPWFLLPAYHQGSGATRGAGIDDGALVLLTGFLPRAGGGADRARLIRRDGSTVARWDMEELDPRREDYIFGILAEPDGALTFILEGQSLAQVDRCGKPSFAAQGRFNHFVARAESGGYWVLVNRFLARSDTPADYMPPHTHEFFRSLTPQEMRRYGSPLLINHRVVRVDGSGRIVYRFSVSEMLRDSDLRHLLDRIPVGVADLLHPNSVQELPAGMAPAFPMFAPGDLLLSLRNIHTLLVVDPYAREIKWHQTGPWVRQHDAQFQPDGTITVFNNKSRPRGTTRRIRVKMHDLYMDSSVQRIDPASGEVTLVAGLQISEEARFHTSLLGQHQMLPGGDVLVVESNRGRVVQFNPRGEIVWEYINRYDADRVGQVVNAYAYPAGYFQVDDWSCPAG